MTAPRDVPDPRWVRFGLAGNMRLQVVFIGVTGAPVIVDGKRGQRKHELLDALRKSAHPGGKFGVMCRASGRALGAWLLANGYPKRGDAMLAQAELLDEAPEGVDLFTHYGDDGADGIGPKVFG